jgi:RNA polymerase sigma factor (sigma-70 family)
MAKGAGTTLLQHLRRMFPSGNLGDPTDPRLLEQFLRQGDQAAFEAVVRRHGPMIWGVCRRLLGNAPDAEDAFQATFLVLVRKARTLSRRELLANWLYGVARRTALKARALRTRRSRREKDGMARTEPAAPEQTSVVELRRVLDEELARLGDKYRRPVVLCYLEGRTRQEAAELLGWPPGTVAGRLARALDLLRLRLRRRGLTLTPALLAAALAETPATALPPALILSTVQAAALAAAGPAAAAGIAAPVATLTKGVILSMALTRMKIALVLLALGVLGGGGGLVARRVLATSPGTDSGRAPAPRPAPRTAPNRPPAPKKEPARSPKPRRLTRKEAEAAVREYLFDKNPRFNRQATFPLKEFTTKDVWKRLTAQVFQVTGDVQGGALFVIRKGEVFEIGPGGSCGNRLKTLCVAVLNGGKRPKLVYSYSWGSGLYRSQIAAFDCLAKKPQQSVARQAYFNGPDDLVLKRVDDQTVKVRTRAGEVGKVVVEGKEGDLKVKIAFKDKLPPKVKKRFLPAG